MHCHMVTKKFVIMKLPCFNLLKIIKIPEGHIFLLKCKSDKYNIILCTVYRPSQIGYTVTTVHVMCMQKTLRINKNLCMVLVPLYKNNLNLAISHTDHYALRK